jgi:hypothetical protein
VEVTVHLDIAQLVTVELLRVCKTLVLGVLSTAGIKHAANALFLMKVEEMPMLLITTPTHQLMLDFGKLTLSTGDHAQEDMLHVIQILTFNVLLRSINGEETPGNSGQLTLDVDADT